MFVYSLGFDNALVWLPWAQLLITAFLAKDSFSFGTKMN